MVALPTLYRNELTGRIRLRVGWFGRLIPQVEVKATSSNLATPRVHFRWRDATRRDVYVMPETMLAAAAAEGRPEPPADRHAVVADQLEQLHASLDDEERAAEPPVPP
jgi:hypothetical protein